MTRLSCGFIAGFAALALSAAASDAQTIGFKLGASMSKLSSDGLIGDSRYASAFAGGGFIRLGVGRLGIQPEILSVARGAELSGDGGSSDETIRIEYIAVPVLLHLPLTYGASFAPYVFGGPEIAFEIGCDTSVGGVETECSDAVDPLLPTRKSTDFGLTAGGGLAFAMGPGALLLEGRYTWGMTSINDAAAGPEVKNRSALFLAGYSIHIGRGY